MNDIPESLIRKNPVYEFDGHSLELALKALHAGAWSWYVGDSFVNWNDKCYELFNQEPGPVSIGGWMDKVLEADRPRMKEMWDAIPSNPGLIETEFRISSNDRERWIRLSGYFIPSIENHKGHATGVMIDITDEKLFNQRLREANFTKDRFFSIIAHDLRSPFTSILGFSRLLNEEYDDFSNDERKMMIKQILSSTEITFQLLDNLLTWAKSQLGHTSFNPENFDIESLILESINLAVPQAKIKGISIKVLMLEKSCVHADANMIRTVIRNLLSNAVKFSYEGGMITIEASKLKDKINISISDTGTGIEPKTLKSLFNIEEKVCSSKGTANEKGSGLGLILCKDFVEKNGGKISVESKVGKGSTFSFTVPLS